MNRKLVGLYLVLIIINLIDIITTIEVTARGGIELNSVARWMWATFGLDGAIILKICSILLVPGLGILLSERMKFPERILEITFAGIVVLYMFVVANNLYNLSFLSTR